MSRIATPYYLFSEAQLLNSIDRIQRISSAANSKLLYSLKACSLDFVLKTVNPYIEGFSCSSAFEAKWAAQQTKSKLIHYTSPSLKAADSEILNRYCSHVSFNSLTQMEHYLPKGRSGSSYALRINPQLSFACDERYDPCRSDSKLGVTLESLKQYISQHEQWNDIVSGIHFHNNCDCSSLLPLKKTVEKLVAEIPEILNKISWINLGGGYLFDSQDDEVLMAVCSLLKNEFNLEIFIEPGSAVVRSAGSLVTSVIDIIKNGQHDIAVLDTSINHMPEVFEYDYEPDLAGHDDDYPYSYILAGGTCLAGDIFGQYNLNYELKIGDELIFLNSGAYSTVKMHMFNGINLPSIAFQRSGGMIELQRVFKFDDFTSRHGSAK